MGRGWLRLAARTNSLYVTKELNAERSEAMKEEAAQARAQREVAALQQRLGADRPATAPTSSTTGTTGQ